MPSVEKKLTLWGGLTVFCSGLFWIVPGFNSAVGFLAIIALILTVARLGFYRGFILAAAGFIPVVLISSLTNGYQAGLFNALIYSGIVLVPGFAMGWGSRNLSSPLRTAMYGFGCLFVLFALMMAQYSREIVNLPVFVEKLNSEIRIIIGQNPELNSIIEKQFGSDEADLDRFLDEFDTMALTVMKVVPGALFVAFLGMAIIGLSIAGFVGERWGIMVPRFRPFHYWRASGWWLLPTIIGLIPLVFVKEDVWFWVGANILIVTGHVYLIVGLAVIDAFFKRIMLPAPARVIIYIIILIAGLITMGFLAVLGLADTRINFKRDLEDNGNKIEE